MDDWSPIVNSYGGFLSLDDSVCLFQSSDGSIPDDISICFEDSEYSDDDDVF